MALRDSLDQLVDIEEHSSIVLHPLFEALRVCCPREPARQRVQEGEREGGVGVARSGG